MIGEEEEEGDGCERNGEKKEAAIVKRASTEIMSKWNCINKAHIHAILHFNAYWLIHI